MNTTSSFPRYFRWANSNDLGIIHTRLDGENLATDLIVGRDKVDSIHNQTKENITDYIENPNWTEVTEEEMARLLANPKSNQPHPCPCITTTITDPGFKGDFVGEVVPWPGHFPLTLDHTEDYLNDIFVRDQSVSEHLAAGLWEEAEAYVKSRFSQVSSEEFFQQQKESSLKGE